MTQTIFLCFIVVELISARLCILKKWPNFKSYGFSLHNIGEYEQQIGTVDEGSPAKYAGLQVDDRIIEINFENVQGKSHSEMVRLIQTNLQQVSRKRKTAFSLDCIPGEYQRSKIIF